MPVYNYFIRPQLLKRQNQSDEIRVFNDLIELFSIILRDALDKGPLTSKLQDILEQSLEGFGEEIDQRIGSSQQKFRQWFDPILSGAKEGLETGEEIGSDVQGLLKGIEALINWLAASLESLEVDKLKTRIEALADIVENDLGISVDSIFSLLEGTIDTAIEELNQPFLTGDASEGARISFIAGSKLASLKHFLQDKTDQISYDRNKIIDLIIKELKDRNVDELLTKASDFLEKGADGLKGTKNLFPGGNDGNNGSQDDPMSWYATWFMGNRFTSNIIGVRDRFRLEDEDFYNQMSFKELDEDFMEHWAHLTKATMDLSEALMHGASMEKGDFVSNLFNLLQQSGQGIFTLAAFDHDGEDWIKAFKVLDNYLFEYGLSAVGTTLSSLESYPGSGSAWALSNWLPDIGETYLYAMWTNSLRSFTMSLFTLINADPEGRPNSINHEKVAGFALGFIELGAWAAAYIPYIFKQEKHYGIPFPSKGGDIALLIVNWVLGGIGLGYAMAAVGWAVGGAIAGKKADNYWKDNWWQILLLSFIKWPLYWFLVWDRNTRGGTIGMDASSDIVNFPGYPDPETSPYKLPYLPGENIQCVQSHYGIWSHNPKTNQIYAVDFGHDEGDEILAMRGGTVETWRDSIPNNSTETWNYITIRHDDPEEGKLPNPQHDRDHTGEVRTRAEYGHGQYLGVQHAFATRGVPADHIFGSPVKPGDLIMYAGDTGRSAYNHLHTHILSSSAGSWPPVTIPFVYREVKKSRIFGFIPVGRDGVPRAFDYYNSENEKRESIRETSLYQPKYHEQRGDIHRNTLAGGGLDRVTLDTSASSTDNSYKDRFIYVWKNMPSGRTEVHFRKIKSYNGTTKVARVEDNFTTQPAAGDPFVIGYYSRESGNDFIVLDQKASDRDSDYKGTHILVEFLNSYHRTVYQYKKIVAYEGGSRKATIEGTWEINPPPGSKFLVGAPGYDQAGAFHKLFGYWAPWEEGNVTDFEDGRSPYTYAQIAAYHRPVLTGRAQAVGTVGPNTLDLENNASPDNDAYNDQHIVIKRFGSLKQYKKITDYNGPNRRITIDGTWDGQVNVGAFGDEYEIGVKPYASASDEAKNGKGAFLAPDDPVGENVPVDFDDGKKPYVYLTFKQEW